ncbi:hypothetical protein [Rhodococcus kronopolitis]|uniref:CU044_5270 family protein n=1 Tax=Rhodococcus kronopolitis TaxID=1460226 RepID=A0ABV9FPC1_9NOCA
MNDDRTALARMEQQNPVPRSFHRAPPAGGLRSILAHDRDRVEVLSWWRRPLLVAASVVATAGLAIGTVVVLHDDTPDHTVAAPGSTPVQSFSLPPTNPDIAVLPPADAGPGDVATVPMLHFVAYIHPVSSRELLMHLADQAERQPPARGVGPYEYVKTRGWYLSTDQTADGVVIRSEIAEIDREQWRADDGSGRFIETENGQTNSRDVGPQDHPWIRLDVGSPPSSQLRNRLLDMGAGRTTPQWFAAFTDTWNSQIVSPGLQSSLLRILADQNGIEVLGAVEDRVGRPGVAVSATTSDERLVLVLDEATGALLDYEQIALTAAAASVPIPLPSTVSYTVWLDAAHVRSTTDRP